MPEWITPELWSVWCVPTRSSFSSTVTAAPGRSSSSRWATASPTIPPPTTRYRFIPRKLPATGPPAGGYPRKAQRHRAPAGLTYRSLGGTQGARNEVSITGRDGAAMTSNGVTRVVLYSMNYAERILKELRYVRFSGERGLCHLAELRDRNTRTVVLMSVPVADEVLEYHLTDLYRLPPVRDRLTVLTPRSSDAEPLDRLVLNDGQILDRLRTEAKAGQRLSIANF